MLINWNYIESKTKYSSCIGEIKYVQEDGIECLAKTNEEKANAFCNYFSSVFNVESNVTFDKLPVFHNISSMPNISFDYADIVLKLKN